MKCALSKVFETLRNLGTLINNVKVNSKYPYEVASMCTFYLNLIALFLPSHSNSIVWTIGYVIPYHAKKLYDEFKVGYGILSMQGKECKNSAVKQELKSCSNRDNSEGPKNKWHQLMKSEYVRNFYLPYHYPINSYRPHYTSRIHRLSEKGNRCSCCFRSIESSMVICHSSSWIGEFLESVEEGKLPETIQNLFKPYECKQCQMRFPDSIVFKNHKCGSLEMLVPKNMTAQELKCELKKRGLSTVGSKAVPSTRQEHVITYDF